jgi:hypothetical protein
MNYKDSIFDKAVSLFGNIRETKPEEVNLIEILFSDVEIPLVRKLRSSPDPQERKMLKNKILAFTPSGSFDYRNKAGLIKHSGLLQFDVDRKDNLHLTDLDAAKSQISALENVAYCGLSVSGEGLWGLVPIALPNKHGEHFDSLEKLFRMELDISIDISCRDVCRLRICSIDNNPYINVGATIFSDFKPPSARPEMQSKFTKDRNEIFVCAVISLIEKHRIDIVPSYREWFAIGCSLANTFNERGRDYYHAISSVNPSYDSGECNRQYNLSLQENYSYSFATFIFQCKNYNIQRLGNSLWYGTKDYVKLI